MEFRNKVMEKNNDKSDEGLVSILKITETASSEVAHHTKAERGNFIMSTPESVRLREW